MAHIKFTDEADRDIIDIYLDGLERWGARQADLYQEQLAAKLEKVAENPSFGANYKHVRPHLRRYEFQSHAVYYKQTEDGILVLRILHGRMDPGRHI